MSFTISDGELAGCSTFVKAEESQEAIEMKDEQSFEGEVCINSSADRAVSQDESVVSFGMSCYINFAEFSFEEQVKLVKRFSLDELMCLLDVLNTLDDVVLVEIVGRLGDYKGGRIANFYFESKEHAFKFFNDIRELTKKHSSMFYRRTIEQVLMLLHHYEVNKCDRELSSFCLELVGINSWFLLNSVLQQLKSVSKNIFINRRIGKVLARAAEEAFIQENLQAVILLVEYYYAITGLSINLSIASVTNVIKDKLLCTVEKASKIGQILKMLAQVKWNLQNQRGSSIAGEIIRTPIIVTEMKRILLEHIIIEDELEILFLLLEFDLIFSEEKVAGVPVDVFCAEKGSKEMQLILFVLGENENADLAALSEGLDKASLFRKLNQLLDAYNKDVVRQHMPILLVAIGAIILEEHDLNSRNDRVSQWSVDTLTPIEQALMEQNRELLSILLKSGADPKAGSVLGGCLLDTAIRTACMDMLSWSIKNGNILQDRDLEDQENIMNIACSIGNYRAAFILAMYGCDYKDEQRVLINDNLTIQEKLSLMFRFVNRDSPQDVKMKALFVLAECGEINFDTHRGTTLEQAFLKGDIELFRFLILLGADVNDSGVIGCRLIERALLIGNKEFILELMANGAIVTAEERERVEGMLQIVR